jgi:hypothetical protein
MGVTSTHSFCPSRRRRHPPQKESIPNGFPLSPEDAQFVAEMADSIFPGESGGHLMLGQTERVRAEVAAFLCAPIAG